MLQLVAALSVRQQNKVKKLEPHQRLRYQYAAYWKNNGFDVYWEGGTMYFAGTRDAVPGVPFVPKPPDEVELRRLERAAEKHAHSKRYRTKLKRFRNLLEQKKRRREIAH